MSESIVQPTCLLPRPRIVHRRTGTCPVFNARRIKTHFASSTHGRQWYRLVIQSEGIHLYAASNAAMRNARTTLLQLTESGCSAIQCMEIEDWPDFEVRGVMLDISRDKVPTMASLLWLVDRFAGLKLNQLQLYTEHTFAYRGHERVWRDASPMTAGQIQQLDRYCMEKGIELVPNQNSFGHMERWLMHDPYRSLAETTGPWKTPWGTIRFRPTTLCPGDSGSLRLMRDLYDQLLPNFSSKLCNIGCDETFELGQGRSGVACRRRGLGRVYLEYLLKLHREVKRRGKRTMFWSDIVHEHPAVIPRIPHKAIPLAWGYEADHPFDRQCRQLAKCGLTFYVCPGTSSWCSISGRSDNAMKNLLNAAHAGRKHGAHGYLITDWGDLGHRQYQPASYAGFLFGATISWCAATNARLNVGHEVSRYFYGDERSPLGPLWFEAGRAHEASGITLKNRTILFNLIDKPIAEIARTKGLTTKGLTGMRRSIATIQRKAKGISPGRTASPADRREQEMAIQELQATLSVLDHGCERGLVALNSKPRGKVRFTRLKTEAKRIIETHRRLWMMRNRGGGLSSSLNYYEKLLDEYR